MTVKNDQKDFLKSLTVELKKDFDEYLKKVLGTYDNITNLSRLRRECPVCHGRQKLPEPFDVECPCREAFVRAYYFQNMFRHTKFHLNIPKEVRSNSLFDLPRITLFRSDLPSNRHIMYLFYQAVKCNLYKRYSQRKSHQHRNIEHIIDINKNNVEFPEYLTYIFLDDVLVLTDTQQTFMDSVLANFVSSKYLAGKSVWLYQNMDTENSPQKFPFLEEQVKSLGEIIEWKSGLSGASSLMVQSKGTYMEPGR